MTNRVTDETVQTLKEICRAYFAPLDLTPERELLKLMTRVNKSKKELKRIGKGYHGDKRKYRRFLRRYKNDNRYG